MVSQVSDVDHESRVFFYIMVTNDETQQIVIFSTTFDIFIKIFFSCYITVLCLHRLLEEFWDIFCRVFTKV